LLSRIDEILASEAIDIAKKSLNEWIRNPEASNADINMSLLPSISGSDVDSAENQAEESGDIILSKAGGKSSVADQITNYNPNTQKIQIDSDPFGISGDYEVDLKIAKSSKQLKKLQKSDFNLIYNRKDGSLYYNVNREQSGFGDRGGLIAILDPKLPLTAANFEIF